MSETVNDKRRGWGWGAEQTEPPTVHWSKPKFKLPKPWCVCVERERDAIHSRKCFAAIKIAIQV